MLRPAAATRRLTRATYYFFRPSQLSECWILNSLPLPAELLARAAPAADVLLGRALRDDLVEDGLLAGELAQDTAQPLDVLARRARPGEDDGDGCVRDVDPLVQDLRGGEAEHLAAVEGFEPRAPLLHAGLVRDGGDEEALRDAVDHLVLGGEDQDLLAPVALQKLREHAQLRVRAECDALRLGVGQHRAPPLRGARARRDEHLPAAHGTQTDPPRSEEAPEDVALALVCGALLGVQFDAQADDRVVR